MCTRVAQGVPIIAARQSEGNGVIFFRWNGNCIRVASSLEKKEDAYNYSIVHSTPASRGRSWLHISVTFLSFKTFEFVDSESCFVYN